MPESPDFEKMAHAIVMSVPAVMGATVALHRAHIAEQLRLVWNARGAVDISALETAYGADSPPLMKTLDRAIRAQDR
jgi:hypothetical protein